MPSNFFKPNPVFMRRAIDAARENLPAMDGGPFGACLVRGDEVLAVAHNTVLKDLDPTCHGEINAIRLAARKLQSYDLTGCEIYSTTEPCPMCFAAIHWARIARLIYGTAIIEVARLGFNELTLGSRQMQELGRSPVAIYPGFLADACRQLLAEWARMAGRQVY
ncbi:MAG: nucleoside deaminase [Syntrophales bacterium]|nr:nucleoside deaminase [Syntrophales bacterium]